SSGARIDCDGGAGRPAAPQRCGAASGGACARVGRGWDRNERRGCARDGCERRGRERRTGLGARRRYERHAPRAVRRAAPLAFAGPRASSLCRGQTVSRRHAADDRRPRAHRKRLVGRPGHRPRLLHCLGSGRRAALGVPGSGGRALVLARKVRLMRYAELHALSNFTFLRGASHPEELVERAADLGYAALAVTDECSVAGVVRAHVAAEKRGIKLIVGSEFSIEGSSLPEASPSRAPSRGFDAVVLAPNRASYGALCALISCARRAAPKGEYRLAPEDFARYLEPSDCMILWRPGGAPDIEVGAWLEARFRGRLWLAVSLLRRGGERRMLERWREAAEALDLPMTAAGGVLMHVRERRPLQDTLTAIRLNTRVDALGFAAHSNGERHLRPLEELARLYPQALLEETIAIADRVDFSLRELRYEYPYELVP